MFPLADPEQWMDQLLTRFGRKPVTVQEIREWYTHETYGVVVNGKNTGTVSPTGEEIGVLAFVLMLFDLQAMLLLVLLFLLALTSGLLV